MVNYKKLDSFFDPEHTSGPNKEDVPNMNRHTQKVRLAKLLLPSIAASLIGLLIIFPNLKQSINDLSLDITKPRAGELEKLHVEKTVFYITDKDNNVHNFTATNIDETEAGSKLIKISEPEGTMPVNITAWINIKAPTGYFNQEDNTLLLDEDVEMFYSEGMNVATPEVTFNFKESRGYNNSPVIAEGFMGDLDAQGFEFFTETGVLIFKGKTNISIREESLKQ